MADQNVTMSLDVLPGSLAGITTAAAGFGQLIGSAAVFTKMITKSTSAADSFALTLTAGLGLVAVESSKAFGEYERAMKVAQVVSDQTNRDMQKLGRSINDFSVQYRMSIDNMTDGLQTLGRAGLKSVNTQIDVLETGLGAAKLSGLELNNVLEKIVQTTSLLGGEIKSTDFGSQVQDVTDKMIATSMTAPITMEDVVQTLSFSGGTAAAGGMNIQNPDKLYDYLGAISAFAQKGVTGSIAGTALRAFFTKPAAQDKSVVDALSRINLNPEDLWENNGQRMKSISDQIGMIHKAMEKNNMSTLDQIELWGDIVGAKMGQQMMKLDEKTIRDTAKDIRAMSNSQDLAKASLENYASDVSQLEQQVMVIWRNIGEGFASILDNKTLGDWSSLIKWLTKIAELFSSDWGIFAIRTAIIGLVSYLSSRLANVLALFKQMGALLKSQLTDSQKNTQEIEKENAAVKEQQTRFGLTRAQTQALARSTGEVNGELNISNNILTEFLRKLNQITEVMRRLHLEVEALNYSQVQNVTSGQYSRFFKGRNPDLQKKEMTKLSRYFGLNMGDLYDIYESDDFRSYTSEKRRSFDKYPFYTASDLKTYINDKNLSPLSNSHENYFKSIDAAVSGIRGDIEEQTQTIRTAAGEIGASLVTSKTGPRGKSSHAENMMDYASLDFQEVVDDFAKNPDREFSEVLADAYTQKVNKINEIYDKAVAKAEKEIMTNEHENGGFITAYDFEKEQSVLYTKEAYFKKLAQDREKALAKLMGSSGDMHSYLGIQYYDGEDYEKSFLTDKSIFSIGEDEEGKEIFTSPWKLFQERLEEQNLIKDISTSDDLQADATSQQYKKDMDEYNKHMQKLNDDIKTIEENRKNDIIKVGDKEYTRDVLRGTYTQTIDEHLFGENSVLKLENMSDDEMDKMLNQVTHQIINNNEIKESLLRALFNTSQSRAAYSKYQELAGGLAEKEEETLKKHQDDLADIDKQIKKQEQLLATAKTNLSDKREANKQFKDYYSKKKNSAKNIEKIDEFYTRLDDYNQDLYETYVDEEEQLKAEVEAQFDIHNAGRRKEWLEKEVEKANNEITKKYNKERDAWKKSVKNWEKNKDKINAMTLDAYKPTLQQLQDGNLSASATPDGDEFGLLQDFDTQLSEYAETKGILRGLTVMTNPDISDEEWFAKKDGKRLTAQDVVNRLRAKAPDSDESIASLIAKSFREEEKEYPYLANNVHRNQLIDILENRIHQEDFDPAELQQLLRGLGARARERAFNKIKESVDAEPEWTGGELEDRLLKGPTDEMKDKFEKYHRIVPPEVIEMEDAFEKRWKKFLNKDGEWDDSIEVETSTGQKYSINKAAKDIPASEEEYYEYGDRFNKLSAARKKEKEIEDLNKETFLVNGEKFDVKTIEQEIAMESHFVEEIKGIEKQIDALKKDKNKAEQEVLAGSEEMKQFKLKIEEARKEFLRILELQYEEIKRRYNEINSAREKPLKHFSENVLKEALSQYFDEQISDLPQEDIDAFLETDVGQQLMRDFEKKYGIEQAKKARDDYKKKKPKEESAKYAPQVEEEYKNLYYDEDSTARELQYRHAEEDEKAGKRYAEKIKKGQQSASYRRKAQIRKATEVARYDLVNYDELKKDYDNYVAALEARGMEASQSIGSYVASRTETKYLDDKMTGGKAGIYTLPKGTLESLHTTALTFDKDAKIVEDNVASGIKRLIMLSEEFENTVYNKSGFKDDTYMGPESGSYFGRDGEKYLSRELDLGGKSARNWLKEGLSNAGTNFLIGLGAGRIDENGKWAPLAQDKGKSKFRVALSHWMGMGMYGNIFSGAKSAIGKLPTDASRMSKAMAGFGGALAGLGTFMGPLEVGMMLVNGAMQIWAQQQQEYNEKLSNAMSKFSEMESELEEAEEKFEEEYERKNKKATQEQKDEAYLNMLYTRNNKDDGLDNYRHKVYDKIALMSMNIGKISNTLQDYWHGPAGTVNQDFWTPIDNTVNDISKFIFRSSREDKYRTSVAEEQDYYRDLFITNYGKDTATYSTDKSLDETINDITKGVNGTPAQLAYTKEQVGEYLNAASGKSIDDWNDMERVKETWIEDIEDFSEQTRWATHVAFEGMDSMAAQQHAYRNIFGGNGYTQAYYDFEKDLRGYSENTRLRMVTAMNQMPDYFSKMQRLYFGTAPNKYGRLGLVGKDTKAQNEREKKILTNIMQTVGGIDEKQAKSLLVLSTISQINELVKNTIEPQLISQTESAFAAALHGGVAATGAQGAWSASEAVNAGVGVIAAQLATVVQAKVMELQGYEATAAGLDSKDVYAMYNAKMAGTTFEKDNENGKIKVGDKEYTQRQWNDAINIAEGGFKAYGDAFRASMGYTQEEMNEAGKKQLENLQKNGASAKAQWDTIKKYGTWAGTDIINKKYSEQLEEQVQTPDDGTGGSGDSDKDKDKDNKNRKNWVNLAICNKKEIPKLNVNLFKKPPNFTILNRNFKLRDVNVNTADDAKSIQNAVKNSIIEIQNRSNPKIIQDDAAEYDPINATEGGKNIPTGTKKTE